MSCHHLSWPFLLRPCTLFFTFPFFNPLNLKTLFHPAPAPCHFHLVACFFHPSPCFFSSLALSFSPSTRPFLFNPPPVRQVPGNCRRRTMSPPRTDLEVFELRPPPTPAHPPIHPKKPSHQPGGQQTNQAEPTNAPTKGRKVKKKGRVSNSLFSQNCRRYLVCMGGTLRPPLRPEHACIHPSIHPSNKKKSKQTEKVAYPSSTVSRNPSTSSKPTNQRTKCNFFHCP